MMFTKVYALSDSEFRSLIVDLFEEIREEFGERARKLDEHFLEDYLMGAFEDLLCEGGVDGMVIFGDGVEEIYEPADFVEYVRRRYGRKLSDLVRTF
jgi:hypothetical protein